MANWTQQEMEELMAKMTKKAMTDAEFRKEVLADANKALEKLAGKALPEGLSIKCIERDPNFQNTLVLPDFVDEEKLDDVALTNVAGGIKIGSCAIATCLTDSYSKGSFITVIGGPSGFPGAGDTGSSGSDWKKTDGDLGEMLCSLAAVPKNYISFPLKPRE